MKIFPDKEIQTMVVTFSIEVKFVKKIPELKSDKCYFYCDEYRKR